MIVKNIFFSDLFGLPYISVCKKSFSNLSKEIEMSTLVLIFTALISITCFGNFQIFESAPLRYMHIIRLHVTIYCHIQNERKVHASLCKQTPLDFNLFVQIKKTDFDT